MRRTSLLAASGLLGALLSVLPAAPASAEDVYERPADGTFEVEGHGWGHGRGMSQWGAQGAALQGRTADEITSYYYAGTQRTVLAPSSIRVWLTADTDRDTTVYAAQGLTATDLATGEKAALPSGPSRFRVRGDSSGLHLESLTGSTWSAVPLGGSTTSAGPVRFSGTTLTRVAFPGGTSRDYRGAVQAVRDGSGLRTVVVLSLEDYLLGVVPRESSSGWRPAALQAQAIAARSYSASKRARVAAGATYDICDTTACQVFGGSRLYSSSGRVTELEPASTTAAVRETAGVVRTYDGRPVFAEFSSSSGGWTASGDVPYLTAREDPWDDTEANPQHDWRATLPVSALERRFSSIGSLTRMRVTGRNGGGEWGGRVTKVVLEGSRGSVTTTGEAVRQALPWPTSSTGMRSAWFRVTTPATGSAVVEQSAAPALVRPPGASTGSLTAVLRNTGTSTWPADGLHLAISSPPGQADALAGRSTRPGRYTGTGDVGPGQTAAFRIDLDAAGVAAGTHARVYRVRLGDGPVLGSPVSWKVVVAEARFTAARAGAPSGPAGARSASSDAPPAVFADGHTVVVPRAGSTTVRLRATNTGNVVWPVDGTVLMGTSGPRDRTSASSGASWVSGTRAARLLGSTPVRPGAAGTFDVVLHGAGRPVGVTFEQLEPVWAGRHWLDGMVTRLAAVRVDPSVSRLAALHSAPTTLTIARDGSAVLVVRLRNLGGSPWRVGQETLTTSVPEPLRTAAWLSPTRPPALAVNASRPGVANVHPGEIGEWRVPLSAKGRAAGTYRTTLQAVYGGRGYGPRPTTTTTVR
ncbi:MAG: hypothetical protein JWO60_1403 [Frankiales bacterium]|nr:hypothetical protein [Frankiales bacterium]